MVDAIWEELEATGAGRDTAGFLIRRVAVPGGLWLAQALECPSNIRILSLRVSRTAVPAELVLPEGGGFDARLQHMPGEVGQVHLQLLLSEPNFQDIFSRFAQDLIDRVSSISDERAAVVAFVTQLTRWQAFLRNRGLGLLGEMERQGLYGELWVLRHLLLKSFQPEVAVAAWTGPRATPQDFRFANGFLEVKTTGAVQPRELTISSANQLDDSAGKPIVLVHIPLRLNMGGETLPELIAGLREDLESHPTALHDLETRLFEAGYQDVDAMNYKEPTHMVQAISLFKVSQNFPRIIPRTLPAGVTTVEYTISLTACRPHAILKEAAMELMGATHE